MGIYISLTDGELAEKLNQHDKAAIEEVYFRYAALLYNHALKMLKDRDKSQDVVQEIFTSLLSNDGNLALKAPLDAYLYRAVKNHIIDAFRKDKNKEKYLHSLKDHIQNGEYKTEEIVLERELKLRIERAVAGFPPKMREVFEMSRNAHYTRREIALAVNVSEETVKMQMKRALRILRSRLGAVFMTYLIIIFLFCSPLFHSVRITYYISMMYDDRNAN